MATMAKRDYYEVLGVSRSAGPEEIKKAFRNKARHLHPDNKESGDEAAFKELAEAYEVLSDDSQRTMYDRYGHEAVKGSTRGFDNVDFSSFAGFGIDDFIDFFFGGGMRTGFQRGGPEQGAHLKYDLEIDFLEAVFGTEKKVTIRRLDECGTCKGTGAQAGVSPVTCQSCAGMGQVQQVMNSWFGQSVRVIACPDCEGAGTRIEKPCSECKGQGLIRKAKEIELKVPAGIESGSRLRLSNCGDKGRRGGTYGDLFVIIHAKEHKEFVREGTTIHLRQDISFSLAALGGEISASTVDGKKTLKIPAGIQSGTQLTMREMGVPRMNNPARRGDQIVHIVVETPTKLSGEERKLLQRLAELRGEKLTIGKTGSHMTGEKQNEPGSDDGSDRSIKSEQETSESKVVDKKNERAHKRNVDKSSKSKSDSSNEEESSILDRIVEAFRPKNGEHDTK